MGQRPRGHAGEGIYQRRGFSAAHLVLHLIERYADRDTAIWCAKYFQLDWSRQSQLPFAVFMGQKAHADQAVRAVQASRAAIRRSRSRRWPTATLDGAAHAGAALSPGHRQQHRRIRAAGARRGGQKRLENSRKSVSEVMYEVGYNDTKAFRDIFSKYCGMSPVGYRERYQ